MHWTGEPNGRGASAMRDEVSKRTGREVGGSGVQTAGVQVSIISYLCPKKNILRIKFIQLYM